MHTNENMHRSTPLFDNAAKRQRFVGPPLAVPKRVVQGHCLNAQLLQRQFLHAAGVQAMSLAPVPQAQRQLVQAIVVGLHVKLGNMQIVPAVSRPIPSHTTWSTSGHSISGVQPRRSHSLGCFADCRAHFQ